MNRRKFLARSATAAVVASAAGLTAMAATTNDDPDARLRAAWNDYRGALSAFRSAPLDIPDEESDRLDAELTRCEDAMDAVPARSLEGVVIKSLYRLARGSEDSGLSNAIIAGTPVDYLTAIDWRDRADLAAARDLLAMAGPPRRYP